MALGILAHFLLRRAYVPAGMRPDDFDRRRKIWFVITTAAFVSGNFWIFAAACAITALLAARKETNEMALFVAVLFAGPPIAKSIPGFGPIEFIIPLSHERILNYCILFPLVLKLFRERHERPRGARLPDVMVGFYIAYLFIASLIGEALQGALRSGFYLLFDVGGLYYVASRSTRTLERFREVIIALLVALSIVALIAIFESLRSWWLYDTLRSRFGMPGGGYIARGDLNLLRAQVSLGHPIVLGLAMGLGLMLHLSVGSLISSGKWRQVVLLLLVAGCLMPFSRGPWVGTLAGAMVLVFSGPDRARRFGYAFLAAIVALGLMSVTSFGRNIYNMLPFVGPTDTGSVDYRQQLWEVSLQVWKQNLWFGDMRFLRNPLLEVMRQGEGIIDMVNTYLQIGLSYGVVGVALFAGCAIACWRATAVEGAPGADGITLMAYRRGLRACIVTLLVTIATVSMVGLLQPLLWTILGLSAGMSRLGGGTPAIAQRKT